MQPDMIKNMLARMGASADDIAALNPGEAGFKERAMDLLKFLREKATFANFPSISCLNTELVKKQLIRMGATEEQLSKLNPKDSDFKAKLMALYKDLKEKASNINIADLKNMGPEMIKNTLSRLGATDDEIEELNPKEPGFQERAMELCKFLKSNFTTFSFPELPTFINPDLAKRQLVRMGVSEEQLAKLDAGDVDINKKLLELFKDLREKARNISLTDITSMKPKMIKETLLRLGASAEEVDVLDPNKPDFKTRVAELFQKLRESSMPSFPNFSSLTDKFKNAAPEMMMAQLRKLGASPEQLKQLDPNRGDFKEKALNLYNSLSSKVSNFSLEGFATKVMNSTPDIVKMQLQKMGASSEQLASLDPRKPEFKEDAMALFKKLRAKAFQTSVESFEEKINSMTPEEITNQLLTSGATKEQLKHLNPDSNDYKEEVLDLFKDLKNKASPKYALPKVKNLNFIRRERSLEELGREGARQKLKSLGASSDMLRAVEFDEPGWTRRASLQLVKIQSMHREISIKDSCGVMAELRAMGADEGELMELDEKSPAFYTQAQQLFEKMVCPEAVKVEDRDGLVTLLDSFYIDDEKAETTWYTEDDEKFVARFNEKIENICTSLMTGKPAGGMNLTLEGTSKLQKWGIDRLLESLHRVESLPSDDFEDFMCRALEYAVLDPENFPQRRRKMLEIFVRGQKISLEALKVEMDDVVPRKRPEFLRSLAAEQFSHEEILQRAECGFGFDQMRVPIQKLLDPIIMGQVFSDLMAGLSSKIFSVKEMVIKKLMSHVTNVDLNEIWNNAASGAPSLKKSEIKDIAGKMFMDFAAKLRVDKLMTKDKLKGYKEMFEEALLTRLNVSETGTVSRDVFLTLNLQDVIAELGNFLDKQGEGKIDQDELSNYAMKDLSKKIQTKFNKGAKHVTNDVILHEVECSVHSYADKIGCTVPEDQLKVYVQSVSDAVLEMVDKDGSGDIDQKEWTHFTKLVQQMNRKNRIDIVTLLDVIDRKQVFQMWDEIDIDGDGTLDHEELNELIFQISGTWVKKKGLNIKIEKDSLMVKELCAAVTSCVDKDNDNSVSKEEFDEFFVRVESIKSLTHNFSDDDTSLKQLLDTDVMKKAWLRCQNKNNELHVDKLGDFILICLQIKGKTHNPPVIIDFEADRRLLDGYIEILSEVVQDVINEDRDEWITNKEMLQYHDRMLHESKKFNAMTSAQLMEDLEDKAIDIVWQGIEKDQFGKANKSRVIDAMSLHVSRVIYTDRPRATSLRKFKLAMDASMDDLDGKINKDEFDKLKNRFQNMRGMGVKIKAMKEQIDLNMLNKELKNRNVDDIYEKFDITQSGYLGIKELHTFFKHLVWDLSGRHNRRSTATPSAVNEATEALVGIALSNISGDRMTKEDFTHFSAWFDNSLKFVSAGDIAFIRSLLLDQTLPPEVKRILYAIAESNREIPPEQLKFVSELIESAKHARRMSKINNVALGVEMQGGFMKKVNEQIANSLPKGEVADLFSDMAEDENMTEEMRQLNEEMRNMVPISSLASLDDDEAKELEAKMKKKAMAKMTEMLVDQMPGGGGAGMKKALANASKGWEVAEKIRAAVGKALGYDDNFTLAELRKLMMPGALDEGIKEKVDEAIHSVIDSQLDEQGELLTKRLVKFTAKRLEDAEYEESSRISSTFWSFLYFVLYRIAMAGALVGGAILFSFGLLFVILFGLANLATCACFKVDLFVLWLIGSWVAFDTGVALLKTGAAGIISPEGGAGAFAIHIVETLFDSRMYAKALVRLNEMGAIDLNTTLDYILGYLVKIVIGQLKAMNLLELLEQEVGDEENGGEEEEELIAEPLVRSSRQVSDAVVFRDHSLSPTRSARRVPKKTWSSANVVIEITSMD